MMIFHIVNLMFVEVGEGYYEYTGQQKLADPIMLKTLDSLRNTRIYMLHVCLRNLVAKV